MSGHPFRCEPQQSRGKIGGIFDIVLLRPRFLDSSQPHDATPISNIAIVVSEYVTLEAMSPSIYDRDSNIVLVDSSFLVLPSTFYLDTIAALEQDHVLRASHPSPLW